MSYARIAALAAVLMSAAAKAIPTQIAYSAITPTTVESFENYSPGPIENGHTFNGFKILLDQAWIYAGYYCASNCLISHQNLTAPRGLRGFAPSTTEVGFTLDSFWRLGHLDDSTPPSFLVSVLGNSGRFNLTVQSIDKLWLGFEDQAGLLSISIAGGGGWNYSLDDITTHTPIPEPNSCVLISLGLLAILTVRRRCNPSGGSYWLRSVSTTTRVS
jgi:hypothetical protein